MSGKAEKVLKSFGYAGRGIRDGFKGRNFKIQLTMGAMAVVASIWLKISLSEWLIVLVLIGLVLAAELLNTSIEEIGNLLNKKLHLEFSETTALRDLGAGAVLVTAIAAAMIGLIIFVPKLLSLLS